LQQQLQPYGISSWSRWHYETPRWRRQQLICIVTAKTRREWNNKELWRLGRAVDHQTEFLRNLELLREVFFLRKQQRWGKAPPEFSHCKMKRVQSRVFQLHEERGLDGVINDTMEFVAVDTCKWRLVPEATFGHLAPCAQSELCWILKF
jgi:hypothetical protein